MSISLNPLVPQFNFSHSLMSTFDCGLKTRFYLTVPRDEAPKAEAASRGIRLHENAEQFLKGETVQFHNEDEWRTFDKIKDYLDSIYHDVENTEMLLMKPLHKHIQGKGIVDAQLKNGLVLDWKFPGRGWNADRFLKYCDTQGWFYLWLSGAPKITFVVCPTKGPLEFWHLDRDDVKIARELRLWEIQCAELLSRIENDNFEASPGNWKCRYCFFKTLCPSSYA